MKKKVKRNAIGTRVLQLLTISLSLSFSLCLSVSLTHSLFLFFLSFFFLCLVFWPLSAICASATFGTSPPTRTCAKPGTPDQDAPLGAVQPTRLTNCTLTLILKASLPFLLESLSLVSKWNPVTKRRGSPRWLLWHRNTMGVLF